MRQHLNGAGNGATSDVFRFKGVHQDHVLYVSGSFDGGTVQLESTPDGGDTWIPVSGGDITEATVKVLDFIPSDVRITTSGGGASMSVSAWTEAGGYHT